MKIILLFAFLAIALHAEPTFYRPEGWALGTEFPSKPKTGSKKTKTPKGIMVELHAHFEKHGEVYGVERVIYPISIPEDKRDAGYEGGKRGMLKRRPGTIIQEEKIQMGGHEGRRYLVEYNEGTRLMDHRVVIVGNEIYQFMYERFKTKSDSAASAVFFEKIALAPGSN
jgi:hypothetical protein